jgi:hypothetical protein
MFKLIQYIRRRSMCARAGLALAIAIAGAFVFVAAPTDAHAATCRGRNFVDGLNLLQVGTATVRVTGSDQSYDHIEPVSIPAAIRVDLCGTGALHAVIVHFGSCSGHQPLGCTFNPIMYMEFPSARDFHAARDFSPFAISPDSPTGQSILQKCNAVADDQRTASEDRNVGPISFFVTLGVHTRRDTSSLGAATGGGGWGSGVAHGIVPPTGFRPMDEYSRTFPTLFNVNVVCAPLPQPIKAPPQPVAVNISVDPKGEVCPKETEVTAWIYYDEPATAQFRFKLDGKLSGLYTRETVKIGAPGTLKSNPPAAYLVKETRTYHLDPGQHRFRVEVRGGKKSEVVTRRTECPPFKVTSAWLNYDVENKQTCPKEVGETATFKSTRPGKAPFQIKTQGGLVVHSGTAVFERKGKEYRARVKRDLVMNAFDQDMIAEIKDQTDANSGWTRLKVDCMEVLSGTLDLRAFAATRCEGEATLSIRANMPGKVPYKLDCTGNRSWTGTAQVQQTGPDTYLGVDVHRFDVSNNEQVSCALKTDAPFPVRILQLRGHKYQCHKPSGASGTSDFTPPGRPDDPPPPGQTLKGDFTFVDNGGTKCPRQGKALINFITGQPQNVHYSLDCTNGSFSGVAQTAKSPKGGYIAPALVSFEIKQTTQANCALTTVAPGKPQVHMLKGHLFQCIKPSGVSGTSDLAPPSRPDPVISGPKVIVNPPRASDPAKPDTGVQIACVGGVVRYGKCACDRTAKLQAVAKNAWRCVKTVVIDPRRTPSSTQPKISCAGGSVKNDKCACARGFNAVAAGTNAFRCVRTATLPSIKTPAPTRTTPTLPVPKIACTGGVVRSNRCVCPGATTLQNGVCKTAARSVPLRSGATPQRAR